MENSQPGGSGVNMVTRIAIFNMAKECAEKDFAKKLDFVEKCHVETACFPVERKEDFLRRFARLKYDMKSRWQAAGRAEVAFLKKNYNWLQGTIEIPMKVLCNTGHRPQKSFEDLCERSKRRKTESLRENNEAQEILFAGQMMLRESGNIDGATVVKNIMTTGSKDDSNQKENIRTPVSSRRQLTPQEALSMFVEASLTRKQYEIIRACDKDLFPCYTLIQKEKMKCYPSEESVNVNSVCAEVKLQQLLNHTVERLLSYLDEVLDTLSSEELSSLELIYKWGCDGSHQKQFKQKFENMTDSDAHIFQSSLVPLQLICKHNDKVIWRNPTPSSPRFCRPMRIRFVHETKDITNEEIEYFNNQIKELQSTKSKRGSHEIDVTHKMLLTMVDGKVCNAATQTTSTMRCFICKLTSKDFNDLTKTKEVIMENTEFGLSILHARIRLFESLLHLSYKLPLKRWQARSQQDKNIVKDRKSIIQEQFRNELGLIIDVPKPGFGSSNDGNTSRRFFANAGISARITGIDQNLIERFAIILEVISSGHEVDTSKFSIYCEETAKLYIHLYPWQPMTPTVHKILIHGPTVIDHALLPIGSLSEEAAEARNKHFRLYRECYSRKFSREQCNIDVLNRLLLTSDPFLSSIRSRSHNNKLSFSATAKEMLLPYRF